MRDQSYWTWHVAAGVVILVFAGLHMAIMHLDAVLGIFNPAGGHPIDWPNVLALPSVAKRLTEPQPDKFRLLKMLDVLGQVDKQATEWGLPPLKNLAGTLYRCISITIIECY